MRLAYSLDMRHSRGESPGRLGRAHGLVAASMHHRSDQQLGRRPPPTTICRPTCIYRSQVALVMDTRNEYAAAEYDHEGKS